MSNGNNQEFIYKGKTYTYSRLAKIAQQNNYTTEDLIKGFMAKGMKKVDKVDTEKEPEDGGFFEDLYTSMIQGFDAGFSVNEAFDVYKQGANISDEDLQAYINAVSKMDKSKQPEPIPISKMFNFNLFFINFKTLSTIISESGLGIKVSLVT